MEKNARQGIMVKGVLVSTGAMITRFNGRDPRLLRELYPRLEADGIEFMVYPSWDGCLFENIEAVRAIQRDIGMNIPVLHADKRIGELLSEGGDGALPEAEERLKNNLKIANMLGAGLIVLHLWGGKASDYSIERNVSVLGDYMRLAEKHGVLLTVENVVCADKSPLTHLKTIMEKYPDARFTVDTKMAEFNGELKETVACEKLWDGRTRHLHVNDYGGDVKDFSDLRVLHMGEGHVDFAPFLERVASSGYEGYMTIESSSVFPDGTVDIDKLNRTVNRLRNCL